MDDREPHDLFTEKSQVLHRDDFVSNAALRSCATPQGSGSDTAGQDALSPKGIGI